MNARLVLLSAAVLAAPIGVGAQGRPLTVSGTRPLTFGTVLPGVPRTVLRTDPANSGEFELRGEKLSQVQLTFVLPGVMVGPAGATMPVSFGGGDGGYSLSQAIGSQVGFDPTQPFLAVLSNTGKGSVFLGATANPGVGQRAGPYAATVTLSVAYTGL
jgi:hypothetical protein